MSITKIWAIHRSKAGDAIGASVKYIKRENEKLDLSLVSSTDYIARIDENYEVKPTFITSVGCEVNELTSKFLSDEIIYKKNKVSNLGNGKGGKEILAYHVVQSFPTHIEDIPEEEVHNMGLELLAAITENKFAGIVVTHNDTNNFHNHIIFNAFPDCNYDAFTKFKTTAGRGENATFSQIRKMNDSILKKNGYQILEPNWNTSNSRNKKKLWQEKNTATKEEITLRNYIYTTVNMLKDEVKSYAELKDTLVEYGITLLDEDNRKHTRYIVNGISTRPIRARSISATLQKEMLEEYFNEKFEDNDVHENLEKAETNNDRFTFNEVKLLQSYVVKLGLDNLLNSKRSNKKNDFKKVITKRDEINEKYILDFMEITKNIEEYRIIRQTLNNDLKKIKNKKYAR